MTPEDWIALYEAHCAAVYTSVSRRVGGDRALAEDLVQEAWLAAVDAWPPPAVQPRGWLLTCAMNRLRNQLKRRRPRPVEPEVLEQISLEPNSLASGCDSPAGAELLQSGLARLTPEQAALIEDHHLEGLPLAEIARNRGLSVRAVEGRLTRARRALAKALRKPIHPR